MSTEAIYKPGKRGDAERVEAEALAAARELAERTAATAEARARRDERRMAESRFHRVTVTTVLRDEGTPDEVREVDRITFECSAADDADCHTYPECTCETWMWDETGKADQDGHPRVAGQQCWLTSWFDAPGHSYVGDGGDDMRDDYVPPIDRAGHIVYDFMDEWVEWDFVPESHVAGDAS